MELARTVDDDPVPPTSCSPFLWNGRDEAEAMEDATNHIETQLGKFGVQIGRGGYKVNDVHSDKVLLNFCDPKVGDFHGGTDVVASPRDAVCFSNSRRTKTCGSMKTDCDILRIRRSWSYCPPGVSLVNLSAYRPCFWCNVVQD